MVKQSDPKLSTWLYRGLALGISGLMIVSFSMPWWTCVIQSSHWIHIYGWGLRHNLVQLAGSIVHDITPSYQIALAWVYLAACVGLIALSAFKLNQKKNYLPTIMLLIVGLSYIAYTAIAGFMVIARRVRAFNINLQGQTILEFDSWMVVAHTKYDIGFYLAFAAGFMCLVLALLRWLLFRRSRVIGTEEGTT